MGIEILARTLSLREPHPSADSNRRVVVSPPIGEVNNQVASFVFTIRMGREYRKPQSLTAVVADEVVVVSGDDCSHAFNNKCPQSLGARPIAPKD